MKLLSWNVRGLGARSKRVLIKDLISKVDHLLMLQETKLTANRKVVKTVWSSCRIGWVVLDAEGSSGGILLEQGCYSGRRLLFRESHGHPVYQIFKWFQWLGHGCVWPFFGIVYGKS